jgi:hypothetical protein
MQPQQPNTPPNQGAAQPMPQQPVAGGAANTAAPAQPRNPNSTQNSLLISELREGMAIMNDGSFRAVVACQSINFDLMSSREQEGIEFSYQSFLNSLYFPVQIFVRSQRVDIGPYIERLANIRRTQDNMLLGVLMDDYINFIAALSEETNIMDKDFYIVVPYFTTGDVNAALSAGKNIFSAFFKPQTQQHIHIDQVTYDKAKTELSNRVNAVLSGLFQMGIKSAQLNTKQLGELYYNVYNPDTAVREPLGDFEANTSTYVSKGQGRALQNLNGVDQ